MDGHASGFARGAPSPGEDPFCAKKCATALELTGGIYMCGITAAWEDPSYTAAVGVSINMSLIKQTAAEDYPIPSRPKFKWVFALNKPSDNVSSYVWTSILEVIVVSMCANLYLECIFVNNY